MGHPQERDDVRGASGSQGSEIGVRPFGEGIMLSRSGSVGAFKSPYVVFIRSSRFVKSVAAKA
jgi:hypothetical protein